MKIIIDIPEEMYEELKSHYKNTTGGLVTHEAIANGTPLPKGHGRLIDADEYSRKMREQQNIVAKYRDDIAREGGYETEQYYRADSNLSVYIEARLILDKIPTIIEADKEETQ